MSDASNNTQITSGSTGNNSPTLQSLESLENITQGRGGVAPVAPSLMAAPAPTRHETKVKVEDLALAHNLNNDFDGADFNAALRQEFDAHVASEEQRLRDAAEQLRAQQTAFLEYQAQVNRDLNERQNNTQLVQQQTSVAFPIHASVLPTPIVPPSSSTQPSAQPPPASQQSSSPTPTSTSPTDDKVNAKWFAAPKTFNGDTSSKAQEWISRMRMHVTALKIPPQHAAMVAMTYLEGLASKWASNRCDRVKNTLDSWEAFETDFRATYLPVSLAVSSRISLQTLKQQPKQTALEYIQHFDALLSDIPDMDMTTQVSTFIMGLNLQLRAEVVRARCTTLEQAKNAALQAAAYALQYGLVPSSFSAPSATLTVLESNSDQEPTHALNFIAKPKPSSNRPRNNKHCSHCKKRWHDDSQCWILHPELKPASFTPAAPSSNATTTVSPHPSKK